MAELRQNTWTSGEWYEQKNASPRPDEVIGREDNTDASYDVDRYDSITQKQPKGSDLYVWGDPNLMGGVGSGFGVSSPTKLPGKWFSISGTENYMRGLKLADDGTGDVRLFTWGNSVNNQLGMLQYDAPSDAGASINSPVQMAGGDDDVSWKQVASCSPGGGAYFFNAGIKRDGTLWTWGKHVEEGELGRSHIVEYDSQYEWASPKQVGSDDDWRWVTAGENHNQDYHAFAIKTDGTLWSWGDNQYGNLGLGDGQPSNPSDNINHRSSPTQIPGTNWKSVVSVKNSTCATKSDGTLWTWGQNTSGMLGLNQPGTISQSSPVQVGTDTDWDCPINDMRNAAGSASGGAVPSGRDLMLVRKTNGNVFYMGSESTGNHGITCSSARKRSSPCEIGDGRAWAGFCEDKNFKKVVTFYGGAVALGVTPTGELWSWGETEKGKLGLNQKPGPTGPWGGIGTHKSSPCQIPGTWSTTRFPGGTSHDCNIVCWFKD